MALILFASLHKSAYTTERQCRSGWVRGHSSRKQGHSILAWITAGMKISWTFSCLVCGWSVTCPWHKFWRLHCPCRNEEPPGFSQGVFIYDLSTPQFSTHSWAPSLHICAMDIRCSECSIEPGHFEPETLWRTATSKIIEQAIGQYILIIA